MSFHAIQTIPLQGRPRGSRSDAGLSMPDTDLTCTLIQQPLAWQEPGVNRRMFAELIAQQAAGTDLIVLPEMFTSGFGEDIRSVAEPADGETLQWLASVAASSGAVVTGSYAVLAGDRAVNRLLWMRPDGRHEYYDKRHLFRMGGEHRRYRAGREKLLVELKGWRICPMICYDLRFPVWCRNSGDYDLMIFVANWPAARDYHWSTLLKARAIENLACVIGVNRIGKDGRGHDYCGNSVALDAMGRSLVEPGASAGVYTATFNADELNKYRQRFPAHLDADRFHIILDS